MRSKSPSLRRNTPAISGRRPEVAAIASARSDTRSRKAEPTVPTPSSPIRATSVDIAAHQVVPRLASDDQPRLALAAEDDRRARDGGGGGGACAGAAGAPIRSVGVGGSAAWSCSPERKCTITVTYYFTYAF